MGRSVRDLYRDTKGAVAATVALSLIALIGVGGIAFDYARLAGLDTELQGAADQAALAAATQLDRQSDSIARANSAIQSATNTDRLAANYTLFANDSQGSTVNLTTVYCSTFDDSKADSATPCTVTTDPTKAQFVVVTTALRIANYALTPIVGALPGSVSAKAVAGVQSSVCDIAPLVVCAPKPDFPTSADIGKGLVLKPLQGASGNYGLLDFGTGTGAAFDALMGFGLNGCQATSSTVTEPGTKDPVTDALNTRLDVYNNKNNKVCGSGSSCTPACDTATGNGCPAANARKDMIFRLTDKTINTSTNVSPTQAQANTAAASLTCPADGVGLLEVPVAPVVGFPRDTCHYGTCPGTGFAGNVGDGTWTRQAYFTANHPGMESAAATSAGKAFASLSRYDVYKWESTNAAALLTTPQRTVSVASPSTPKPNAKNPTSYDWTVQTQCGYPAAPASRTGYPKQKDRRVLPIVAADCTAISGKTSFDKLRAFDVFLTEPSADRTYPGTTNSKEIYGEIVGPSSTAAGGSGFQYYSHNKPYLVR